MKLKGRPQGEHLPYLLRKAVILIRLAGKVNGCGNQFAAPVFRKLDAT